MGVDFMRNSRAFEASFMDCVMQFMDCVMQSNPTCDD